MLCLNHLRFKIVWKKQAAMRLRGHQRNGHWHLTLSQQTLTESTRIVPLSSQITSVPPLPIKKILRIASVRVVSTNFPLQPQNLLKKTLQQKKISRLLFLIRKINFLSRSQSLFTKLEVTNKSPGSIAWWPIQTAFQVSSQEIQKLPSKAEKLRILQQSRLETTVISMNRDPVFSKSHCKVLTNSKADFHLHQMQTAWPVILILEEVPMINLLPTNPKTTSLDLLSSPWNPRTMSPSNSMKIHTVPRMAARASALQLSRWDPHQAWEFLHRFQPTPLHTGATPKPYLIKELQTTLWMKETLTKTKRSQKETHTLCLILLA